MSMSLQSYREREIGDTEQDLKRGFFTTEQLLNSASIFLEPFDVDTGLKMQSVLEDLHTCAAAEVFSLKTCGGEVDRSTTAGVPESALNSSRE